MKAGEIEEKRWMNSTEKSARGLVAGPCVLVFAQAWWVLLSVCWTDCSRMSVSVPQVTTAVAIRLHENNTGYS